jgi:peptidyl-dipeptidase A
MLTVMLAVALGCGKSPRQEAQEFLDRYMIEFQKVYYNAARAQWLAGTDIKPEHDSLAVAANKAYADFVGSRSNIEKVRALLARKDRLDEIQARQLEKIWLDASHQPGTIPDVVEQLIKTQTEATNKLYSFEYKVGGKILMANDIDDRLLNSKDIKERLSVWTASKDGGKILKPYLADLQTLRNKVAQEMGYSSFFDLESMDYGMKADAMVAMVDGFLAELQPLYEELHTYVRYELARRYNQPVPEYLPAHWLTNRWAQNWPGLVEGVASEGAIPGKDREWVVRQAEDFYVSMGFEKLNENFWKRSDLYTADPASGRKKNTHASAWHLDLDQDYRSLMSVEPNFRWFKTTHHELGHIYYFIEYSNPHVPLMLRAGANRSYHEAMGDLIAVACSQEAYLKSLNLLDTKNQPNEITRLLNDALSSSSIVFLPFAAGTMTHFEYDLYEKNLPKDEFNKRWWAHVKKYQGVVPPTDRGEEFCDAATKTHIIDDPGQYYDYALSCILKFHLHHHIAKNILKQDPRNCNYYGSKEAGEFLKSIMHPGASRDWRKVLKEKTGEDLSARAMLEYYQPLYEWLKKENEGRKKTQLAIDN